MSTQYNPEAEQKLLGLILKNNALFYRLHGYIKVQDFYVEENKMVFSAMETAHLRQLAIEPIILLDLLALNNKLDRKEWFDYLNHLIFQAGIESNLTMYMDKIKELSQKRVLEDTLLKSAEIVGNETKSMDHLIETVEENIFKVTRDRQVRGFKDLKEITNEFVSKFEHEDYKAHAIRTGIDGLDDVIGGFNKGDFVILAARPSVGKTAIALLMAKNISANKNVAFMSIEMPSEQLYLRLLANQTKINMYFLRNPKGLSDRDKMKVDISKEKLSKLHLRIDDSPSLKIGELMWKARMLKSENKIDVLFIDYIGLITSDTYDSRYQLMTDISRQLKQLARELQIPIIALSQLSRGNEKRDEKSRKPMLSDLRDSGAIEQDADIVLLLHRPEYYQRKDHDATTTDKNTTNHDSIELLEIDVAKNRNGRTANVKLNFKKSIGDIVKVYDDEIPSGPN